MSSHPRAGEMDKLARKLWGAPTENSHDKLRFGAHGSKAIDLVKLTWFDHEAGKGGGLLDLYALAKETPPKMNGATSRIVAEYDYRDEHSALLFQVVRLVPKTFRQRRPDPAGKDGWTWKLGDVRRVLYRLPELIAADPGQPVFVVEGEKEADALRALGLVATTNPGGASEGKGRSKWRPEYGKHLRGRDVVILPDNDDIGRAHAEQVRDALKRVARSVCVLELPTLPDKGDVSDWIAKGGTADALLKLAGDAAATAPPDDADAEAAIAGLAGLPPLQYARELPTEAKRLGVLVSMLDKLVKAARGDGDTKGQGRPVELPAPDPWPDPVNGADLCNAVSEFVARYVALPEHAATALTLWPIHTHCFDLWRYTPRLHFTAPTRRAGKTRGLTVVGLLAAKPLRTESITPPALFRTVEAACPTLMIDEVNALLNDNADLVALLNSGYERGGTCIRTVGDNHEPRAFATFCPVALAGIGGLAGTLADRAITIAMKRALRTERRPKITEAAETEAERLRRQIARWVADHRDALRAARPDVSHLPDRVDDRWTPLFAIAAIVGGDWPDRVAKAATALTPNDDGGSLREQLLADLRDLFNAWVAERQAAGAKPEEMTEIESTETVERLVAKEGRPWADMPGRRGGALTKAKLARLLKPFHIYPGDIGPAHRRRKGYALLAFEDAFARHLP